MSVLVRNAPNRQKMEKVLNSALSFTQATFQRQKSAGYSSLHSMKQDLKNGQIPHRIGHHLWGVLTDIPGIISAVSERMTPSLWISLEAEQSPNPNSRVLLSDERDRLGLRKILLHWELTDLEMQSITSLVRAVGSEIGRLGAGRLRIASSLLNESFDWAEGDVQGGYHHMGTTRMSHSPTQGVVDADCKLFGVENLYIAGSSVFPTSGCANPTFTIVALALRMAAHLEKRL
jgi:choline dehydrogenase-like flavoprotein